MMHGSTKLKFSAKSLFCNLDFFWGKTSKNLSIAKDSLGNGTQPLDKNFIPDFALAGSNASMRIHSTLAGLDAILQNKYPRRVSYLSLTLLR